MIKLILILTFLLAFETTFAWTTPPKESQKQYLSDKNQLKNGGFENGSANWTASGGTFAATTTSAQVFLGARAGSWDASASSQTLTSSTWTSKTDASGNGEASCRIKTAATDYVMEVYDGSNVIESMTILASDSSEFKLHSLNFAVSSTSTGYRIRLVSASDAAVLYVDDCYLGYATNLKDVAQAQVIGTAVWVGAASCTRTTTSTSYATFAADTDCNNPTVTGSLAAPSTKILAVTTSNGVWAPGVYTFTLTGAAAVLSTGVTWQCQMLAGSTASTASGSVLERDGASADYENGAHKMVLTLTSSYSGEIAVQCKTSAGTLFFNNDSSIRDIVLNVERFPLESQIAYTQDQANYGWTSYTPTFTGFGTATNIDFKHKRIGSDLHIKGRFTTGTVTAVEPRISLPGSLTSASSSVLPATLAPAGRVDPNSSSATFFGISVLIEPSTAYVVFGKQASTTGSATKVADTTTTFSNSTLYFVDAVIPINGWAPTNVPALLNSVVSPFDGVMKIITAAVETTCSSTPCTITRQSGSTTNGFSSITRASTGDYTANFASGTFSGTPWFCNVYLGGVAGGGASRLDNGEVIGANSFNFVTLNSSFAALDTQFYVMCVGPK